MSPALHHNNKKEQVKGNGPEMQSASGHGGMLSAKIDPVSRNAIWKEHCLKEEAKRKLSSEFSINPSTLVYIAEKPNKYKPSITLSQEEINEAKQLLGGLFMSNATDLTPTEKYEMPQTASQEYGWCSRPLRSPLNLIRLSQIHFSTSPTKAVPLQNLQDHMKSACTARHMLEGTQWINMLQRMVWTTRMQA